MHKFIRKLFKKHLPASVDPILMEPLEQVISDSFTHQENEARLLQRSMKLMSDELNEINQELRARLRETKNAEESLHKNLIKQKALLDATLEAVFRIDDVGNAECCNQAAENLLVQYGGQFNNDSKAFLRHFFREGKSFSDFFSEIEQKKQDNQHGFVQSIDGRHFEFLTVPEIFEGKVIGLVSCLRDVTASRRHQEVLKHQAYHDYLTGLPNRMMLLNSLKNAVELAEHKKNKLAVLFIDLDDFKKINDTAGHEQGDKFLISVAKMFKESLREQDVLGRLGGDEFLIILKDIESQKQIIHVHDRILQLFAKPFLISGSDYSVSCSIGISFYPQDGVGPDELIRKADMAMYQAKAQGKNTFHYFDESLERIAIHRVSMEAKLRAALQKQEFSLQFQPKVSLEDGNLIGVEALLRWTQPNGEIIYPDQFIPVAEESGLIKDLTLWVLRNACKTLLGWKRTPLRGLPISINISAIDFSDEFFLQRVFQIVNDSGIDPRLLEFELTESVFFGDIGRAKEIMAALKEAGILLSIDDFGTGYSSLSYLQDLDIDFIKIDKSFITNVHQRDRAKALVKSMVDIGANLGIQVVAEGIETQEELDFLVGLGCPIGQGYWFSRPLALEQMSLLELSYQQSFSLLGS